VSQRSAELARRYALALAHAFAESAGTVGSDDDFAALASVFEDRFQREAQRLPRDGRDEFLSAVALELLDRIGRGEVPRDRSPAGLEASFRRATLTVLGTIRQRIARDRARDRIRDQGLQDADDSHPAGIGPDLEGLVRRELAGRLSPEEMTVLYLATEGQPVDEIAKQMDVSRRTIYRALQAIRASLEESRREDAG
jgi:DNA-binding CsgD family transcriptional regulator